MRNMVTIADIIRTLLLRDPLYGEAAARGIVNYRAMARLLKKDVEEARMEPVSQEAIAIALRRFARELSKRSLHDAAPQPVTHLSIRANLSIFAFENSPHLPDIHRRLLLHLATDGDAFLQYSQGMRDTTFVTSESVAALLSRLSAAETLLRTYTRCSMATVVFPRASLDSPGVCERYFRALAWEQISLVDFILSYTELSFVVEEKDAQRAFAVLHALAGYEGTQAVRPVSP